MKKTTKKTIAQMMSGLFAVCFFVALNTAILNLDNVLSLAPEPYRDNSHGGAMFNPF